jgi:hypothetical protein
MPTVIPRETPKINGSEAAWRAPRLSLKAPPTGMVIEKEEKPSGQPGIISEGTQKSTGEDTPEPSAVALSPQLTALARKEQAFRREQQAFKEKEREFEARSTQFAKYAELDRKLAAKDYSALEELGVSYEDWTNYLINRGEGEKPELQAIQKLEQEVTNIKKSQEENVNKQYEATLGQYRQEIRALIEKDPASFEAIKSKDAVEHVLTHIVDSFNEDDENLTVEQAAKEVEEALLEEALSWTKLKKIQEKIAPQVEEKRTLPPPRSGLTTLTQQIAPSGPPKTPSAQFQHLSPKERIAQAIARAQRG